MAPEGLREQKQLLQEMLEQQKAYIEMQEKRIAEKDAAIADLRRLADGLQPLKANLLETLAELRRQFFGAASEKTEGLKPPEGAGETPLKPR
jgi:small-conductance mechanosensitive channel